jgi:lysophospholipase L1-like esterase
MAEIPSAISFARIRRRGVSATVGALLAVIVLVAPSAVAAQGPYPRSIASTGDSITRAYNTGTIPYTDNPSKSWATGTSPAVDSHYLRLLALNPKISGKNYNDAKSGARMADLAGQMSTVVAQKGEYVTVLMGGNDVCTSTEASMTSVASFRSQFVGAMERVTTGLPRTRIFVATIPNVYRLWEVFKDNALARFAWDLFDVCQSMLANPLSTEQTDVDRRARVLQRDEDFNAVLLDVCAAYTQCKADGGAVFATDFTAADVTGRDYFHPSTAGQAKLAAGTWAVSYWAP